MVRVIRYIIIMHVIKSISCFFGYHQYDYDWKEVYYYAAFEKGEKTFVTRTKRFVRKCKHCARIKKVE
jgi:hypothetical protein